MSRLNVALIGTGGFGRTHSEWIGRLFEEGRIICPAFVSTRIDDSDPAQLRLLQQGACRYADYREMLEQHAGKLDFAVVATPVHLHREMAGALLKRGIHVLLEKPPVITLQDMDDLQKTATESGAICAVNFHHTSGSAFRKLLDMIRNGELGCLRMVTGVAIGMRTTDYFAGSRWRGKLRYDGAYVLDGTVNNPFSHLLNNALLAAGGGDAQQSAPVRVTAELYHANAIEAEDTSCVHIRTAGGTSIQFYATLCGESNETPCLVIEGEHGSAKWSYDNTLETDLSGRRETFAFGNEPLIGNMYLNFIAAIADRRRDLYCSLASCRNFVLAANGAFLSSGSVHPVSADYVEVADSGGNPAVRIRGIAALFREAASARVLLSQLPTGWGVRTTAFDTAGFRAFRLFD